MSEVDRAPAIDRPSEALRVKLGMLGTSFMGRAHSRGLYLLPTLEDSPAAVPWLQVVCGRDPERLAQIRERFGWQHASTDWRELVADSELDALIIAATNDVHAEPAIAALRGGKHVLCEKPLARDGAEARRMVDAATEANTVHMCAFNYRFFPAIQLAHQLIAAGELGEIVHFRSRFLLASAADARTPETTWRLRRETAGSGVIGDMLAHHVDLARYLVGEPAAVTAASRTGSPSRHAVTVDVEDAVVCAVEFAGGALATMEATRLTPGHVLESAIEIDGTRGTIGFDVASLNQLTVATASGRRVISVTEPDHPFGELWWPRGHGIGWGDSFIHQARHFLGAIAGRWTVAPHGATFADGYRCAQVCDAVVAAAETGERQMIAADAVSER